MRKSKSFRDHVAWSSFQWSGERPRSRRSARRRVEAGRLCGRGLGFRQDGLALCLTLLVGENDVHAVTGELESGIAAEIAATAGDESNLMGMFMRFSVSLG
jgi:hypothetical protein